MAELSTPDSLAAVHDALGVALAQLESRDDRASGEAWAVLFRLAADVCRRRPVDVHGRHTRHTATCGCPARGLRLRALGVLGGWGRR